MFRIDNASANAVKPAADATGPKPDGYFDEVLATIVTADWLNAVQEELCGIIESIGWTLNKGQDYQLKSALDYLYKLTKNISFTDLNDLRTNGTYNGGTLTNSPDGSTDPFYVTVVQIYNYDPVTAQYAGQFAVHEQTGVRYSRVLWNGAWSAWIKHWSSANDGAGSGLDADLLDGFHASHFLDMQFVNAGTLALLHGGTGGTSRPTAQESLGIYSGVVIPPSTSFSLTSGLSGWTVAHTGTGVYTITHNLASSNYIVNATSYDPSPGLDVTVPNAFTTTSTFKVYITDDAGNPVDGAFSFTLIRH